MAYDNHTEYFAAADAEDAVGVLGRKAVDWFDTINTNGYISKIKNCWLAYHGAYFGTDGHSITFDGEQGELVNMSVNHFRNIGQHVLTMVTSTRPSFQARSTNTDYKSLIQTNLANQLLEYYLREKRLERYLKRAVEHAIVLGTGYIKMGWNSTSGEIVDFNEELETDIHEGDVEFTNLSTFDVVFDSTKETSDDGDWVICRSFKNKFDIAAKYPEHKDKIVGLKTKSDIDKHVMLGRAYDETVDIPIYEFYHKRTESMPDGRYMLYLNEEIVLMDSPMPYRRLPVYRIAPADILGTPYGYTNMFDLLPLQDGINMLHSAIMTNQNAFAVQNVYIPRGADLNINSVHGGLNVLEGNPVPNVPGGGMPQVLNLSGTAPETFNYIGQLENSMETISGVNSVARGNPEASLKSGTALALIQSQALEFISGLQQEYIMLIEDIGTGLINLLKDFASVPRVAAITGKINKTEMKEFTGDDLDTINRVMVDVGNSLSQTTAGRVQIADNLLQMGAITTPQQYFNVMNTGRLETMTEGTTNQLMLIRSENERLVDGEKEVLALATDNHALHLTEHQTVLADPDLRLDVELVQRTLAHIQQHITLLRETDPDLLTMMGQQPLGPVGGSPVSAENVPQTPMNPQGEMPLNNPEAQSMAPNLEGLPEPAQPAPVVDNRPMK
jgi:hypothetical protein